MLEAQQAEKIGAELKRRLPGHLTGLSIVQTDPAGARRFTYWPDELRIAISTG